MANTELLYQTFEIYLKKAKLCQENKDFFNAKKFYLLAAEQMIKLAKESKGDMQKVRFSRAQNLIDVAKSLNATPSEQKAPESSKPREQKKVSLEDALKKLNALEGLQRVKQQVNDWVDQIKAFKQREERGLAIPDVTYHMVFSGNPGTGKTTVARIMAEIYCALGIVSEGHLVEVSKPDMVAGYVGQTAIKTQEVLNKAKGGVLFIDEAYSLTMGGEFGQEAIDTMLKYMEDNRDDLAVIVAGYEEPIENFIRSNQGLRSRFNTFIKFDDYTASELFNIFEGLCKKNQYKLTQEARALVRDYLKDFYAYRTNEFANGRDVRNLFEGVVTRQSKRVVGLKNATDEELTTIIPADLDFPKVDKRNPIKADATAVVNEEKVETPEEKVLENGLFDSEFKFEWDNLPTITFDDVAGLEAVKEAVNIKVLLPLKNADAFKGYVKKSGGGLLLYGPPGTGKTMIAAAIANEIGAKFCSVKPSDLLHQGAGQSEKAIKALFQQARQFPCAVVYFDEMDSISPKNTRSQYAKQLRSEFLAQLQGIESYGEDTGNILFLIAATNKPWDIDSAFIRPGRFGTRIYVGLPDSSARNYIIESRIAKIMAQGLVSVSGDIQYEEIVEKTEGFNCSDIANLLDKIEEISIIRGVKTGVKSIIPQDFDEALEEIKSSVQRADIEKLMEWTDENNK